GTSKQRYTDTAFPQIRRVAMQRMFHDVFEKRLAAMAALECGAFDDLIQVGAQFALVFYRFADLGDGSRVCGAVHFSSHPGLPRWTKNITCDGSTLRARGSSARRSHPQSRVPALRIPRSGLPESVRPEPKFQSSRRPSRVAREWALQRTVALRGTRHYRSRSP